MEFRVLGPLEVRTAGGAVPLPGAKPRAVLAVLLLHANRSVSAEHLALSLWGEEAAAGAAKTVQVHVSRLRKALGDSDVVRTTPTGYELRVDPERIDAGRFERGLARGRRELAAGHADRAASILEQALSEWRGRALEDLVDEPFAQREIPRLEELRVDAFEELVEARLALGAHAEVAAQLEGLVGDHPYRERLWAQLMLALYRCDRQADALQVYRDARRRLVDDLGIEPGARLRELEQAILAHDPRLAPPAADVPEAGEGGGAAGRPARRLVSIVFADIVGSTALAERLDPESMHALLDRYTDVCSAVVESHGGAVEGYIGDAVVGVFGQSRVHEDDALRAVRAAFELREAVGGLSAELERDRGIQLNTKLGVEAGEVFVGGSARRASFAAGDAFNVAARLEQSAPAGEILLGDNIQRLVRDAVRAERLEPLALKGKAAPVQAWRLVGLRPDGSAIPRSPMSPFVNRERELAELRAAWANAREQACCTAVTVLAPAGQGKSRLAQELVAEIGDSATVVVGRCPSYGDGVAYQPLAEIIGQLSDGDPRHWLPALLDSDEPMARMVLAAIGLDSGPVQAEETFWAVRRTLERVAEDRPLVVAVDDLHWAQPTLLDLLEHLMAFLKGHPVLLMCLSRPELVETHPEWADADGDRSLIVLDPLPAEDARQVVTNAGGDALQPGTIERIVQMGEGNPLFLEHLAAVGAETGQAALPSSIHAVLAARIDRLEPGERALLEHASVQGRSFYAGAVEQLLPAREREGLEERLSSLVRKQLIRAERSDRNGERAFRFAHVLVREAAYRGVPRQVRADLHERLAQWLDARPGSRDETVGFHLAEAHRHRADLGHRGARERALASAASERLAAAADAALMHGDPDGGARLLERARSLLAHGGEGAADDLLPVLSAALFEAGRPTEAARLLDEAMDRVRDPRVRARAQVERELVRLETHPGTGPERARQVVADVLPVLERASDGYGQCRAWLLRGQLSWSTGRVLAADEAWRQAATCASRTGSRRELFDVIGWRALAAALGPMPVEDAIRECEDFRELVASSPIGVAFTLNPLALLYAMRGELEAADQLLEKAGEILRELGGMGSAVSHLEAMVRLLAGRPELAEAPLRADVEALSSMSVGGTLATSTALLAQAVHDQGRDDEALDLSRAAAERAGEEDILTRTIWRTVQARILARRGGCGEAEVLAREAVALVEPTDLLSQRGDAMLALAEVLKTCGGADAADAARAALASYERKGNAVAADRASLLLAELTGGT